MRVRAQHCRGQPVQVQPQRDLLTRCFSVRIHQHRRGTGRAQALNLRPTYPEGIEGPHAHERAGLQHQDTQRTGRGRGQVAPEPRCALLPVERAQNLRRGL